MKNNFLKGREIKTRRWNDAKGRGYLISVVSVPPSRLLLALLM
jgi:hypothetical protein